MLDLVVSEFLFKTNSQYNPHELTLLKNSIVRNISLTKKALELQLEQTFEPARREKAIAGASNPKLFAAHDVQLADALESVIGAIYLQKGFVTAQTFVLGLFKTEVCKAEKYHVPPNF